jgi:hypothetical protein
MGRSRWQTRWQTVIDTKALNESITVGRDIRLAPLTIEYEQPERQIIEELVGDDHTTETSLRHVSP